MTHNKSIMCFTLVMVCVALFTGCGKKASDEIDFGTFKDSVYQNKYFGLTIAIPSEWSIQDQESREHMTKMGIKLLAGDDKNLEAVVKASELQTVNLFAVFKHPMGAPVSYNPSIICVAERVRHMPGIKRGKDYLFHARKLLESSQIDISFPKEISTTENLGGVEFDVMHTRIPMAQMIIYQKYYTAIMKGYALAFVVSFSTKEEEASLQSILDSATFE